MNHLFNYRNIFNYKNTFNFKNLLNLFKRFLLILGLISFSFLSACASFNQIDSEVSSFIKVNQSKPPETQSTEREAATKTEAILHIPTGSRWRFERLPSQENNLQNNAHQTQLESWAQIELSKHGLIFEADSSPNAPISYSVTLYANTLWRDSDPLFFYPRTSLWMGSSSGFGHPHDYWNHSWSRTWLVDAPRPQRQLSLLLRDQQTQQVVYETHAKSASFLRDDAIVYRAMLQAALQNFPKAQNQPRFVRIPIHSDEEKQTEN